MAIPHLVVGVKLLVIEGFLMIGMSNDDLADCLETYIKEKNHADFYFRMGFDRASLLLGVLLNDSIGSNELIEFISSSPDSEQIAYEILSQLGIHEKSMSSTEGGAFRYCDKKESQAIQALIDVPSCKTVEKTNALCDRLAMTEPYDERLIDAGLKSKSGSVIHGDRAKDLMRGTSTAVDMSSLFYRNHLERALSAIIGIPKSVAAAGLIDRVVLPLEEAVRISLSREASALKEFNWLRNDSWTMDQKDSYAQKHKDYLIELSKTHISDVSQEGYSIRYRDLHLINTVLPYDLRSPVEHLIFDDWTKVISDRIVSELTKTTAKKMKDMSISPIVLLDDMSDMSKKLYQAFDSSQEDRGRICAIVASAYITKHVKLVKSANRKSIERFHSDFAKECDWSTALSIGGKRLSDALVSHLGSNDSYINLIGLDAKRKLLVDDLGI